MKRITKITAFCLIIVSVLSLFGCGKNDRAKYKEYYYFDTSAKIISYANDTRDEFYEKCGGVSEVLEDYHRLLDIYNEYEGVTNLCTINKNAGGEALEVDARLVDFLLYAKDMHTLTGGEMNVMMGAVLKIWHNARTEGIKDAKNAKLPTTDELQAAAAHTDISLLEIDKEKNTVRISDPEASIDVGALGKGYATEQAAKYLESIGAESYVLNIGGNIRIVGHKPDGSKWKTGVTDPFGSGTFPCILYIADVSCVTSGDYQRYYTVGDVKYHHIIDKDTLMPSEHFSSVTVVTKDSGLADALSTALFCMSYEDGLALINSIDAEIEVLWIAKDGQQYRSAGLGNLEHVEVEE